MHAKFCVDSLSDEKLLGELERLVTKEREVLAEVLAHLAEVERRKLHLELGFASLYGYCVEVLHMAEGAAYRRITAARAARKFPVLLERIADGSLHLAAVTLLAPCLTDENVAELIAACVGKSKRSIEELLAARFPRPDVPSLLLDLSSGRADHTATSQDSLAPGRADPSPCGPEPSHARVEPRAEDRFLVRFTMSRHDRDQLLEAQALMRHELPQGDLGAIFVRGLGALLKDLRKRKRGEAKPKRPSAPEQPRPSKRPAKPSRYVPAAVRREVFGRDQGRCAFVGKDGHRCGERGFLELHHVVPFAKGGEATISNLEIRCAAHNRYQADLDYGQKHCEEKRRQRSDGRTDEATQGSAMWKQIENALRELGFRAEQARRATLTARERLGDAVPFEVALRASLRATATTHPGPGLVPLAAASASFAIS